MLQVTCNACGRVHEPVQYLIHAGWDSVYVGWWFVLDGPPSFRFTAACECDEGCWTRCGKRRVIPSGHYSATAAFDFDPEVLR